MLANSKLGNVLVLSGLLLATESYAAIDSKITLGLNERWESNVFLAGDQPVDDLRTQLLLGLDIAGDEAPYEFNLNYQAKHNRYLDDSFGDQNEIDGTGLLNVSLIPDMLVWSSAIESAVTRRNAINANTPANRDQRNMLQTGLLYNTFVTRRDQIAIDTSVAATRFREAEINDNDSAQAGLNWKRGLNTLTIATAGCSAGRTKFLLDDFEYDSYLCQVGFERRLRQGNLEILVGQRTIDLPDVDKADAPVYKVTFGWEVTKHLVQVLSLVDLQNSGQGLGSSGFSGGLNPIDINTDQRELTLRKRTELAYTFSPSWTDQIKTVIYVDSDDIYKSPEDTDRAGFDISYRRTFNSNYNGQLTYTFVQTVFANDTPLETKNDESNYIARLNRTFSPNFNVFGELRAETLTADVASRDYEAYFVSVGLLYIFE